MDSDTPLSIVSTASKRAAGNEQGGTAIRYALIASGIGAAVAVIVYGLGTTTAGLYESIAGLL